MLEHTREAREVRFHPQSVHHFPLSAAIRELRQEPVYDVNGHTGTTLVKHSDLRVVLQAMQPGAALKEHHAPGPISVQVLEGELRFEAEGEVFYLIAGDLLTLPAGVPHSVEAVKESAFLLTIAPSN